jgi:hypothetical protein
MNRAGLDAAGQCNRMEIISMNNRHVQTKSIMGALLVLLSSLAVFVSPASAYKLKTESTPTEAKVANLGSLWSVRGLIDRSAQRAADHFLTETVHEAITHRIWGCSAPLESDECLTASSAPLSVIIGVRWNDNPPFRVSETKDANCRNVTIKLPALRAECWLAIFRDGSKRAKADPPTFFDGRSGSALLLRSHFGDMQFLHAMAAKEGELASETQAKIFAWGEFTYKVAVGEIARDAPLYTTGIAGFDQLFDKQRGWTPALLFGEGDPVYQQSPALNQVALGSLMHMVQDSFARGHALRNPSDGTSCRFADGSTLPSPGSIVSFRAYARQDAEAHGEEDSHLALKRHLLSESPNVADVGRAIREIVESRRGWPILQTYLQCVFRLEDSNAAATSDV